MQGGVAPPAARVDPLTDMVAQLGLAGSKGEPASVPTDEHGENLGQ